MIAFSLNGLATNMTEKNAVARPFLATAKIPDTQSLQYGRNVERVAGKNIAAERSPTRKGSAAKVLH
jgi:hypothetical protein